ncbi:hypothetical protein LCGC14_0956300 [marine sediment metagenome]|uniref:Uncharacterized protein n=1 Tax=marine sediment metagenome TaxID=412755 RepID=A0A0F9NKE2_9ZZZZ
MKLKLRRVVQLNESVCKDLEKLKIHPRQSYSEVIEILLKKNDNMQ